MAPRLFPAYRKAPRRAALRHATAPGLRLVAIEKAALAYAQDSALRAALAPAPRRFLFL
jgi:hypothetical protein